jgi:CspA family cold shock protein
MTTNATNTGVVKFFNESKGYGFLIDDRGQTEYFFHKTNTLDVVQKDDKVAYSLIDGKKGKNAVNVQRRKE